ncbi:peptidyl-prolyl cis-trans isomerase [Sulfitobacter aestuariivivens]|uniref:Parvulin-like PPIase n=1 Tax=Sulfitobacter aestuariivivens TaxID=2766981 RepID=A0A927D1T1_9RHOB|nr:peptidyl-prolyl cis-trans isomerase [Sulfitobacter aestuariivivens]MBD3663470.1 peptidyl-prolyl cis-trans isomerase [Sulfitobacter aestuariivivens]
MAKSMSISRTAMWILMGLLILALGGFGAVNLSGNIRTIGTVGEKSIPVDQYARQLSQQIRTIEAQTGEPLPFARAQEIGLDRAVLQRLVRDRALDNETAKLGLSIGDTALREDILQIEAFQGLDGEFDREGYRFALQQAGLSESEFEVTLREEASRSLLQNAIVGGVEMPNAYAETLVKFIAERRDFTWARMDAAALETPLATPDDAALRAYYDANPDLFILPPTKKITYAWLKPEALIDEVEVPEEQLREEYDNRADQYIKPERRLVERLVFADADSADQAAAALEVGGTTFEALVEERGLQLSDVDLGDVGRLELDAAGEAVFAADAGDVVGPLPSDLGPALFRINGVLPAQNTTFEEAREALATELATAGAIRAVEARAQDLDDQLAGGATLEQMDAENKMELGTIDWTPQTDAGIAAYPDFRQSAAALSAEDFPKIKQLDDGGIYAMRLDEALPERPNPFEEAKADVRAALIAERTAEALTAQAEALLPDLGEDTGFDAAGLTPVTEEGQTRNGFIAGAPEGFIDQVFEMTPGDTRIIPAADGAVFVVRLDEVTSATEGDENAALLDQISTQINQTLATDVFNIYSDAILLEAGPQIDQRALQAVHVNFP